MAVQNEREWVKRKISSLQVDMRRSQARLKQLESLDLESLNDAFEAILEELAEIRKILEGNMDGDIEKKLDRIADACDIIIGEIKKLDNKEIKASLSQLTVTCEGFSKDRKSWTDALEGYRQLLDIYEKDLDNTVFRELDTFHFVQIQRQEIAEDNLQLYCKGRKEKDGRQLIGRGSTLFQCVKDLLSQFRE